MGSEIAMNKSKKLNWKRILNTLIFPYIAILLALSIYYDNYDAINNPNGSVITYLQNFFAGHGGLGDQSYYDNPISFLGLTEGDIVLGGYPNCSYGRFSHAALYIGDGLVLEGYGDLGVSIHSIDHYRSYKNIAVLQVQAEQQIKDQAVIYAKNQQGKVFYPLAFKSDEYFWNCTKIIWKAYNHVGVDLDTYDDIWVMPDAFYSSPNVRIINENTVL